MLQFKMSFPENFSDLYNKLHNNDKFKKFLEIEGIDRNQLDVAMLSKKYFINDNVADISIDPNANVNSGKTHANYVSEITKSFIKLENYYLIFRMLEKKYDKRTAENIFKSIIAGDIYLHDPTAVSIPYCFATTTSRIMNEGVTWGQLKSKPPKRARSFLLQVFNLAMTMSGQFAGAIAIGDFIVNYAYFAKKDNLSDKEIQNDFQTFVHNLCNNEIISRGSQTPFTNISIFDRNNLKVLFDNYIYPDFSKPDIEYIMHIQKIFLKFFSKGDPITNSPYRFPVTTCAFLVDNVNGYDLDSDFVDLIAECNVEKGVFNIFISDDVGKIASCCRLNSQSLVGSDSFGNGGLNVGSHRVVSINLPRIALRSHGMHDRFFNNLDKQLEKAHKLLLSHRALLHKRVDNGFLKFVKPYDFINIDKMLFSTIGIIGMYECAYYYFDGEIEKSEGVLRGEVKEFLLRMLDYIGNKIKLWSEQDSVMYNLEEVPGEGLASKFALKDKIYFGNNIQMFQIYSNQFIPLTKNCDIFNRIEQEGEFFEHLSGGGICHINLASKIKSKEDMKKIMKHCIDSGLQHFAINYNFSICENDHTGVMNNKDDKCCICGGEIVDRISRVVGFFVSQKNMHKVRREYEYLERKFL